MNNCVTGTIFNLFIDLDVQYLQMNCKFIHTLIY